MAITALADTQSLVNDALFRCGEIPGASEWDAKAMDYITREHRAICAGSSEFLPEYTADWWWMRASGVITLLPVYNTGTVTMNQTSTAITFNPAPNVNVQFRRLKLMGRNESYIIQPDVVFPGASGNIDSLFNGPTGSYRFEAMRLEYPLDANASAIMSPIIAFADNPQIFGTTPERMDQLFPYSRLRSGAPQAFSLENDRTIRFSHGGRTDDLLTRFEYRYRPMVQDLVYDSNNFPLIPIEHRHVLADMVTMYIMIDKNDDRATAIGTSARSTMAAMFADNLRRLPKMDNTMGAIFPRGQRSRSFDRLLRTEQGLIIG